MKFKFRHKISVAQADKLIEKYYDGFTTVEEEKLLQGYLARANLPAKYKPEQALFGYFDNKKKKTAFNIQKFIVWTETAAAILIIGIGVQVFTKQNSSDYAFVDGKKITDIQLVKSVAENSMKEFSIENEHGTLKFDAKELIQQQLESFSE